MKTMLALALMFSTVTAGRANDVPVPPLADCGQIRIVTDDYAWMIDFKSDGSGGFQFGSLGGDGGSFPKGTIDFAKLYQSLTPTFVAAKPTPKKKDEKNDDQPERRFRVAFESLSNPERYATGYTKETDTIEQAFKQGFDALDPHVVNHLEFLLLASDPFRGPVRWFLLQTPETRAAFVEQLEGLIKEGAEGHEQIAINTRSGWKLIINANGSGELSIGRHPSMTATIGAATFDFDQVYETQVRQPAQEMLRPTPGETRATREIPWQGAIVSVKAPEQSMKVVTTFVRDPASIKELFDRAWASATLPKDTPPGARFSFLGPRSMKDAWETRPPVGQIVAPK